MGYIDHPEQRELLLGQAEMIFRSAEESIPEPADLAAVRLAYDEVLQAAGRELRSRLAPVSTAEQDAQ